VQAKAIACERPQERGEPLCRYSLGDILLIMQREKVVAETEHRTWEAELYRLQGELLLKAEG
jgi:hypothetical protein